MAAGIELVGHLLRVFGRAIEGELVVGPPLDVESWKYRGW